MKELAGCLHLSSTPLSPLIAQVSIPLASLLFIYFLTNKQSENEEEIDSRFPPPVKDRTGKFTH